MGELLRAARKRNRWHRIGRKGAVPARHSKLRAQQSSDHSGILDCGGASVSPHSETHQDSAGLPSRWACSDLCCIGSRIQRNRQLATSRRIVAGPCGTRNRIAGPAGRLRRNGQGHGRLVPARPRHPLDAGGDGRPDRGRAYSPKGAASAGHRTADAVWQRGSITTPVPRTVGLPPGARP